MQDTPDAVVPFGTATAASLVSGAAICLWLPGLLAWPMSMVLLVAGGVCWRCPRRWMTRRRGVLRIAGAALVGFGLCGLHAANSLGRQLPLAHERGDFDIRGRVVELPWQEPARTRFVFVVDDHPGIAPFLRNQRLRLAWYDHDARRGQVPVDRGNARTRATIEPGSRWRLRVRLRAPRGLRNPGTLDSEKHAFAQRIAATGYVRDEASARRLSPASGIDAWRDRRAANIVAAVPQASSRYLRALALGDTRGLTEVDWEILRATGLTHLIAISGFHVGLVAGFFALLAGGLWRALPRLGLRMPRPQAAAAAALLGAAGYAAVAGFALPTLRTVLMIAVVVAARLARRSTRVADALALAAITLVLVDPLALLGAGFWLSFAGVAWLAWCLPRAGSGGGMLRGFLSAQMVATIGLLPLTVALFGQASVAGPLANLLAIPWWSLVVVPLSLLGTGLDGLHAGWGDPVWRLAAICFDLAWPVFSTLAASPLALWWLPEPAWFAVPMALFAAFWCLLPRGVPGKPLALLLWLPLLWPDRKLPAPGSAELVVLDVGQGLSVLVRTRGHAVLYDMGPAVVDGFDAGERAVLPALHALGVRRLDLLVASHADADHAGGLEAIRRRFPRTPTLAPEGSGLGRTRPCLAGATWQADGVTFRFLHPPPHFPYLRNESSCVLRVETRHGAALLTGDIGEVIEHGLVARQPDLIAADVVVVAHHGSGGSSDAGFIAATGARHALVSAGHGNRFGHPHPDVLARWHIAGADTISTAEGGALRVRLQMGGEGLEWQRATHPRLWDAAGRVATE